MDRERILSRCFGEEEKKKNYLHPSHSKQILEAADLLLSDRESRKNAAEREIREPEEMDQNECREAYIYGPGIFFHPPKHISVWLHMEKSAEAEGTKTIQFRNDKSSSLFSFPFLLLPAT